MLYCCVCRRAGAHQELQQERRVVRGAHAGRRRGLGAQQLRHARQLAREALLVPRAHLAQRRRVPAVLRYQRQFPGQSPHCHPIRNVFTTHSP